MARPTVQYRPRVRSDPVTQKMCRTAATAGGVSPRGRNATGSMPGHRQRQRASLRDLGHGQPTEEAERQRDPRLRRERRMAAGEEQPQPVVLDWSGGLVGRVVVVHEGRLVLGVALLLAADPVDRAVARGGGVQPPGLGGTPESGHFSSAATSASPAASSAMSMSPKRRTSEAIRRPYSLRKTCSAAAVPPCIDQSSVGPAQARPSNGRTSTLPRHALDPSAASLSATSRSSVSMTQKPPMTSLVSR